MIPFKWRGKYLCFYCGEDVHDYISLKKHTTGHGKCSTDDRALKLVKAFDSEVKIDVSDIICEICSEPFTNFDGVVSHLMLNHSLPYDKDVDLMIATYRLVDLKCLKCDETFNFFQKLVTHVNNSHPEKCFQCSDCDQQFNKKRDLDTHVRQHHKKEYTCLNCTQSFPTHNALQIHKSHAHVSTCNICFQTFSSHSKRLKHLNKEHITEGTECGFCRKTLATRQAFIRHASKCNAKGEFTSPNERVIVDDEDAEKKKSIKVIRSNIACILNMSTAVPFKYFLNQFRCFYCPKDFSNCDVLKEHTVTEHPHCDITIKSMRLRNRYDGINIKIDISSLTCKLCFESIQDLDTLINHLVTEHKAVYDKSVETNLQPFSLVKDNFPCPFCGEVYRYFGMLLKHISTSHTDNRIICVYCGIPFRTEPNLRAHVLRHHKGTPYKCDKCDISFSNSGALQNHSGKVHGSKLVKCSQCPEMFTTQYWMQRHQIITHGTGHKCSYCDKMFTRNSLMVNHVRRLHLKEKNVECSICFDRFFDVQRLKMHMVKHVGERNFHCDVCGKKFLWKRNLRGHMSSHNRANTKPQT